MEKAVHRRQHDIQEHQIVGAAQGGIQTAPAVIGPVGGIAVEDQDIPKTIENRGVVFDDQDARFGWLHRFPLLR